MYPWSVKGGLKIHGPLYVSPDMAYGLLAVTGDALAVPAIIAAAQGTYTLTDKTIEMDGNISTYSISGNTLTVIGDDEGEPLTQILERVTDNTMRNQVEKFAEHAEGGSLAFPFSFVGGGESEGYLAVFTVNTFNGNTGTFDLHFPVNDTTLNKASGNFLVGKSPDTIQFTDVTGTDSGLNTYLENSGNSFDLSSDDKSLTLQPGSVSYIFGLEALYN